MGILSLLVLPSSGCLGDSGSLLFRTGVPGYPVFMDRGSLDVNHPLAALGYGGQVYRDVPMGGFVQWPDTDPGIFATAGEDLLCGDHIQIDRENVAWRWRYRDPS